MGPGEGAWYVLGVSAGVGSDRSQPHTGNSDVTGRDAISEREGKGAGVTLGIINQRPKTEPKRPRPRPKRPRPKSSVMSSVLAPN